MPFTFSGFGGWEEWKGGMWLLVLLDLEDNHTWNQTTRKLIIFAVKNWTSVINLSIKTYDETYLRKSYQFKANWCDFSDDEWKKYQSAFIWTRIWLLERIHIFLGVRFLLKAWTYDMSYIRKKHVCLLLRAMRLCQWTHFSMRAKK